MVRLHRWDWLRVMFGAAHRVALGNQITTPDLITAPQPTFSNVKILLSMNGDDSSTTSLIDLSNTGKTYAFNDGSLLDTAQKKFGTASCEFPNGGTDGNRLETSDAANLEAGSSTFCMELWFRYTGAFDSFNRTLFSKHNSAGSNNSLQFVLTLNKELRLLLSTDGVSYQHNVTSLAQSVNADIWHHIAMTRDSSNDIRLFLRGKLIKTQNIGAVTAFNHAQPWGIGAHRFSGSNWNDGANGWIDDFRWTVGEPIYTVPFIPPTSPHPTGLLELETTSDNLLLENGVDLLEIE